MNTTHYFKWMVFAFLSLFLVACKPTANFIYSPSAPNTGEIIKFDASKSTVYKADEGNAIAIYAWDFGDGSKATGRIAEHSYIKAGKYTVTLNVTDLAGQTNSTTQRVTVKQSSTVAKSVSVAVSTSTGASLPEALVTIQGQSVLTDKNGVATLNLTLPQTQTKVVATFEKSGFITQAIEYDVAKLQAVSARLLDIKQIVAVQNIEKAQKIESQFLGASISIPDNAFAYADGRVATGNINVEFTPWDIQGNDLNAMPANGMAVDAQGNRAQLISAGMISATFKDSNGEKLQLVSGKTAEIQMNLPLQSINNQPMTVGTLIPMWHFDEAKGLWVEEGLGEVIASSESSTGLAVHAKVSHFSTWNWDFKFDNPGSVFVQCQANGVAVACDVQAEVKLKDGSKFTNSMTLNRDGITVINMPNTGSVHWFAQDLNRTMLGETVSGTSGQVIIDLGMPATDHTVACVLPNGEQTACSGQINNSFNFKIAKEGGRILSGLKDTDGRLDWSADSGLILEDNMWVRYKGTQTSNVMGDIILRLNEREEVYQLGDVVKLIVKCEPEDSSEAFRLQGQVCLITVQPYTLLDQTTDQFSYRAKVGESVEISLPREYAGFKDDGTGIIDTLHISGYVSSFGNNMTVYMGDIYFRTRPSSNTVHTILLRTVGLDGPALPDNPVIQPPVMN